MAAPADRRTGPVIPSPVAARHRPRIEALLATVAVLVDDTPTGTCMRDGCFRTVDARSPSTWFCSDQHAADWQITANGGTTVMMSRLHLAERLSRSHASKPLCRCGCVEIFTALSVAASDEIGRAHV